MCGLVGPRQLGPQQDPGPEASDFPGRLMCMVCWAAGRTSPRSPLRHPCAPPDCHEVPLKYPTLPVLTTLSPITHTTSFRHWYRSPPRRRLPTYLSAARTWACCLERVACTATSSVSSLPCASPSPMSTFWWPPWTRRCPSCDQASVAPQGSFNPRETISRMQAALRQLGNLSLLHAASAWRPACLLAQSWYHVTDEEPQVQGCSGDANSWHGCSGLLFIPIGRGFAPAPRTLLLGVLQPAEEGLCLYFVVAGKEGACSIPKQTCPRLGPPGSCTPGSVREAAPLLPTKATPLLLHSIYLAEEDLLVLLGQGLFRRPLQYGLLRQDVLVVQCLEQLRGSRRGGRLASIPCQAGSSCSEYRFLGDLEPNTPIPPFFTDQQTPLPVQGGPTQPPPQLLTWAKMWANTGPCSPVAS